MSATGADIRELSTATEFLREKQASGGTGAKSTRWRSRRRSTGYQGVGTSPATAAAALSPVYGGILVNAALLMLASAWTTGQPAPAGPAPAAAPAPIVTGSCNSCGDCCDNHRGCWRERFHQWCHRNDCCQQSCQQTCHAPSCRPTCHQTCQPACRPVCCQQPACRPCPPPCPPVTCCKPVCQQTCCQPTCNNHCRQRCHTTCRSCNHGCNSCNSGCNDSCGGGGCGFFGRLRGLFHRQNCCDDCNTCGHGGGGTIIVPKAGEPIPAPKKMPGGEKEVRIITPPTGAIPAAAPSLEVAPSIIPPADADNRNPF